MCQFQVVTQLLCLLCLIVGIVHSQSNDDAFPQCANVEPDTFVVAIDDCTSYIYCNGENSFRDTCPDQTYFDGKAQECAFDDQGVCLQRLETTTIVAEEAEAEDNSEPIVVEENTTVVAPTQPVVKPMASRPHCDLIGDGYHAHPERCEYYYSCLAGYLSILRCPYKFGWDYAEGRCKPRTEAQCFSL